MEVRRWDAGGRVGGAAGRGPTSNCSAALEIANSPELGTRTDRLAIGGRASVWTDSGVRTTRLSIQLDARTWGNVSIYATDAALRRLRTSRADMAVRVAGSIRPDSAATLEVSVTLAPERTPRPGRPDPPAPPTPGPRRPRRRLVRLRNTRRWSGAYGELG